MGKLSKSSAGLSYSRIDELSLKTQTSYNDLDSFEGRYFKEGRSIQKVVLAAICPFCLFM
jgi:hypothetical protein